MPGERDVMDRMEIIKLLHQQDTLHTMLPQEKEEVKEGGREGGKLEKRKGIFSYLYSCSTTLRLIPWKLKMSI